MQIFFLCVSDSRFTNLFWKYNARIQMNNTFEWLTNFAHKAYSNAASINIWHLISHSISLSIYQFQLQMPPIEECYLITISYFFLDHKCLSFWHIYKLIFLIIFLKHTDIHIRVPKNKVAFKVFLSIRYFF